MLLYWHWIVFGLILIGVEIFLPSFMALWFGVGAIITGLVLWLIPEMSLAWQLCIWGLTSAVFTVSWFRFVKPKMTDRTKAGMGLETLLGETGMVVKVPVGDQRGQVRFSRPLLGNEEWDILCAEPLEMGDRVAVVELSGNALVVQKRS